MIADVPSRGRRHSEPVKLGRFTYEAMREYLHRLYPGRQVFSPLEPVPTGQSFTTITMYTSPRKDGVGRSGSSVFMWAVSPTLDGKGGES